MAKSSNRSSAKMNAAMQAVLNNAMRKLNEHYGAVLADWPSATPEQKQKFLAHSPILIGLMDWCDQWRR